MKWAKDFYTAQYKLLGSSDVWATFSPARPLALAERRATDVAYFAGEGKKRVLELGCGSGIVAGAIAELGHSVVAVDIVAEAADSAQRIASQVSKGEMIAIQGDFYTLDFADKFDVVCYFDGFGIGSDADQRRLLKRIHSWLKPTGCAIVDVYTPWYFAADDGMFYDENDVVKGRMTFDAEGSRLQNSIWLADESGSEIFTQSLRCYAPVDLRLLLEGTGLSLAAWEPYDDDEQKGGGLLQAPFYRAELIPYE